MKHQDRLIWFLGVALISCSAYSSEPARRSMQDEVVAQTKRLSAEECKPRDTEMGRIKGCEYTPTFVNGKWGVFALRIFVDENGKNLGVMGADTLYEFDKNGKFIRIVPGM